MVYPSAIIQSSYFRHSKVYPFLLNAINFGRALSKNQKEVMSWPKTVPAISDVSMAKTYIFALITLQTCKRNCHVAHISDVCARLSQAFEVMLQKNSYKSKRCFNGQKCYSVLVVRTCHSNFYKNSQFL